MIPYGTRVVVNYTGKLEDGTVFDSTSGIEPLEYEIGSGFIISGFDDAIRSMEIGERKTVSLEPDEAFGAYNDSKVETANMYQIPNAKDIRVGKPFYFITQEGVKQPAKVLEINEGVATIDFNHPLAGKRLIFDIELLDVKQGGGTNVPNPLELPEDIGPFYT